jgi:hypothetical protein
LKSTATATEILILHRRLLILDYLEGPVNIKSDMNIAITPLTGSLGNKLLFYQAL